jgi:hypothetical protein
MLRDKVEKLLAEGGRTASEISSVVGCATPYVYEIARRINVAPKGTEFWGPRRPLPPAPRPHHEILADLAGQLDGIVGRFERQVDADYRKDPIYLPF